MKNSTKINFLFLSALYLVSSGYSNSSLNIYPVFFSTYKSSGGEWNYQNKPIIINGFGLGAKNIFNNWILETQYIQISLLGNVNNDIMNFSSNQSFPYIDGSKDADGYWNEYATAKISYIKKNFKFEAGKFDRHWGPGLRGIHISNKAPSYPQFGFEWNIKDNLKLTYFHGFLNSNIPDSSLSVYYKNNFSRRSLNINRSIAAHRLEWNPLDKIIIGLNESVVYAVRSLDFHYLLAIIPLYPIENYLGDIDNLQMGFDFNYNYSAHQSFYLSFFMDEFTPEWLLKSKNHNWFAYQIGYNSKKVFNKSLEWGLEYNWTDQRIYKHKFEVNDSYSHQQPLGFWAGPHAQEFISYIFTKIKGTDICITLTDLKRGLDTSNTIQENYRDLQPKRFDKSFIIEKNRMSSIRLSRHFNKELLYALSFNYINFFNSSNDKKTRTNKSSFEIALFYNFKIKSNNKLSLN